MATSDKIVEFIKEKGQIKGIEIASYLGITRQALFKHLPKLLATGAIIKVGKPPKVFYSINEKKEQTNDVIFSRKIKDVITQHFLIITPAGEKKEGADGFIYWCNKNSLPIEKTANEYAKTIAKYSVYQKDGFINGNTKIKNSFPEVYLDEVLYLDFYSIERFGKTKLGQLLLYAKQSQNITLMNELIKIIKPKIEQIVKKFNIDGIGFVPPTVKREKQLMKVLEKELLGNLRKITITKITTPVAVPQKTLNKLEDRIENAKNTLVVSDNASFNNILLIDDAVGSGATLNEIAKKIKDKGLCKNKIVGLAITGSFKGFDVISEV